MKRNTYTCDRCGAESNIAMTDNIRCSFGRCKDSKAFMPPPFFFQRKDFCRACEVDWNETFYNAVTEWWTREA